MKLYQNKNIGHFISLPTKQFKYEMLRESDRFLDTLYFARYFRKLENGNVEQIRSSPHYDKTLCAYRKLLANVDIRDIPAVETALKYNIELFNPSRETTQQLGGDVPKKRKSYFNVQILRIGNNKYKPILQLGGDGKSAALTQPSKRAPRRSTKPRSIKPVRSAPRSMRASTKLEEQMLIDLETVQQLDSAESRIKFSNEFLTNPAYVNILKFVPAFIFFHHERDANQSGGAGEVKIVDLGRAVSALHNGEASRKAVLSVIDNFRQNVGVGVEINELLTDLSTRVKNEDMSDEKTVLDLFILLEQIKGLLSVNETQEVIGQLESDPNTKAGEVVNETREVIRKLESDPNTKAGEVIKFLKYGGQITLKVIKTNGEVFAKVIWAIISVDAKPDINSDNLSIENGTEDFLNQVTKTPNTEVSKENKRTLSIYRSFILITFMLVLSSLSRYTGQNVTPETVGISGESKVINTQYVTEVKETLTTETQKNVVNHDPFAPAVQYNSDIERQAERVSDGDKLKISQMVKKENIDGLNEKFTEVNGGELTQYKSREDLKDWGDIISQFSKVNPELYKFMYDTVKNNLLETALSVPKGMLKVIREDALEMIVVAHKQLGSQKIPVDQILAGKAWIRAKDVALFFYKVWGYSEIKEKLPFLPAKFKRLDLQLLKKIMRRVTRYQSSVITTFNNLALMYNTLDDAARGLGKQIISNPLGKKNQQTYMKLLQAEVDILDDNKSVMMNQLPKFLNEDFMRNVILWSNSKDVRDMFIVTIKARMILTDENFNKFETDNAVKGFGFWNYLQDVSARQQSIASLATNKAASFGISSVTTKMLPTSE